MSVSDNAEPSTPSLSDVLAALYCAAERGVVDDKALTPDSSSAVLSVSKTTCSTVCHTTNYRNKNARHDLVKVASHGSIFAILYVDQWPCRFHGAIGILLHYNINIMHNFAYHTDDTYLSLIT